VIIASEGVNLSSNVTITASFKAQAKARPTLHKFVGHISLSFSPEDLAKLDDKKIAEIAQEYNLTGGLSPCEHSHDRDCPCFDAVKAYAELQP